jgi:hypothetical protein
VLAAKSHDHLTRQSAPGEPLNAAGQRQHIDATRAAIEAFVRGEPVDPAAIYFRCAPTFEVSHPALAWMTESLFIGTGARFPDRVEMRFFRVA